LHEYCTDLHLRCSGGAPVQSRLMVDGSVSVDP
jgi:hypothetical protein